MSDSAWIDEIEARLASARCTYVGRCNSSRCPLHGGEARALRKLLRVARAAIEARERVGDVALSAGVFAEHGSGPEGQRVLAEVWRALEALDDALRGEEPA